MDCAVVIGPARLPREAAGGLRSLVISGLLLALPSGLLPVWGYHIQTDFGKAADYFLAMAAGIASGVIISQRYGNRAARSRLAGYACFAGAGAIVLVSFAGPPAGIWTGLLALFLAACAAGALNTAALQTIGPAWQANAAGVLLTGGIWFAAGSALCSVFLARCFESSDPARLVMSLAAVPAIAGASMLRSRGCDPGDSYRAIAHPAPASDFRTVLAFVFAMLLFFQFANEWSIAAWLPVLLIDRLGISPQSAVDLLALYWLALGMGRLGASRLLIRVRHGVLLAASAFCALFGCAALVSSSSRAGSISGLLIAGFGFSAIYPLASEKISTRFSSYQPGRFNGVFTFALLGGTLMPFVLGHAAASVGLGVVPLAAMIGSCAVVLMLLFIWLGRTVSGA